MRDILPVLKARDVDAVYAVGCILEPFAEETVGSPLASPHVPLACNVESEARALAVFPVAHIYIALRVGKVAVSLGYGVLVHLARIGAGRVGPRSAYEGVCPPCAYYAVVQRVVAYTLSAAFAHAPLSCIHYAVANGELSVAVVLAVLNAAPVGCVAVAHHCLIVGGDVAAACEGYQEGKDDGVYCCILHL